MGNKRTMDEIQNLLKSMEIITDFNEANILPDALKFQPL